MNTLEDISKTATKKIANRIIFQEFSFPKMRQIAKILGTINKLCFSRAVKDGLNKQGKYINILRANKIINLIFKPKCSPVGEDYVN